MAVQISQNPGDYNLAYGPNAITLTNLGTLDRKYILQIKQGNTTIADIRQLPNIPGDAIFDIQNILQSYVKQSVGDIESKADFTDSTNETFYYQIHAGAEDNNQQSRIDVVSTLKVAIAGVKTYYEVDYDMTPFTPEIEGGEGVNNCTTIREIASALTDMPTYPMSSFSGGKPYDFRDVYNIKATDSDEFTMSYWNQITRSTTVPPVAAVQQAVELIRIVQYNGNTLLSTDDLENLVDDGGGPNDVVGEGIVPLYPYHALTHGCGPKNGSFTLNSNTTHYYVYPTAYTPLACNSSGSSGSSGSSASESTDAPTVTPLRVDIVEPDCLDYDHLQFSWTNSFGFRDYYTFTKKNERKLAIKRNTYFKEAADYASTSFSINPSDRGMTTYSQLINERYMAETNWLSDIQADYLEGLYKAPDVRVKINDTWFPVVSLTNSYTEKTYRKDKLFQFTINFEIAHPLKSQRG